MVDCRAVLKEIQDVTKFAVRNSFCNSQNFPSEKNGLVSWSGDDAISETLRNVPYGESYASLDEKKSYNMKLLDGALVQMQYIFEGKNLKKHRLSFYPSPDLLDFSSFEDDYNEDRDFLDIVAKNIVHVPVRFDYDDENAKNDEHPASHLTIGQYKNCRIPVTAPMMPLVFIRFIFENFYNTLFKKYKDDFPKENEHFEETITDLEREKIHIAVG